MVDIADSSFSKIIFRSHGSSECLSRNIVANIVVKDDTQDPPLSSEFHGRLQFCIDENNEDHMTRSNEQDRLPYEELANDSIVFDTSTCQVDIVRQLSPDPPHPIMLSTHSRTLSDPDWSTTPDVQDETEWSNVPPPHILHPPESLVDPKGVGYCPYTSERNTTMSKNCSPGFNFAVVVRSWECSWGTASNDEIDSDKLKCHDDLYVGSGCRDEGRRILGTSCGSKKGRNWVKIITSLVALTRSTPPYNVIYPLPHAV